MKISLYFEPRDLWVGLFWDWRVVTGCHSLVVGALTFYICLIPCLVLRIQTSRMRSI